MNPASVDPHAWASAIIELIKGGGWIVGAIVALFIVCRWPPWRRKES